MVVDFEAEMPIGTRTCCDLPGKTGKVSHQWLENDVPEFTAERARLQAGNLDAKLSRRHHLDAVAQIGSLMKRAAKGQLPVGVDHTFPCRVIRRVPYLLELRPALSSPRIFRLYYAEPRVIKGSLLPLVLSTKQGSSDNVEQNQSIEEAKVRSRIWTLQKAMRGNND